MCFLIPFQLERHKTQADLSLKNLQQTHDDLKRRSEVMLERHVHVQSCDCSVYVMVVMVMCCRYDEAAAELKKFHQQSSDSHRRAENTGEDGVNLVISYRMVLHVLLFLCQI